MARPRPAPPVPLLWPFLALAGGVAVSRAAGFGRAEAALALAACCALCFIGRLRALTRMSALFFAGALVACIQRPGAHPRLDAPAGEVVLARGCIVLPPSWSADREEFVLELAPGARALVTIYPRQSEKLPDLRYGQTVEIESRLRQPRRFRNPGAFDYPAYLARRDIYWTGSVTGVERIRLIGESCGSRVQSALFGMREWMLRRIDLQFGHSPTGGLLRASLLGDVARLKEKQTEAFRQTGTYHLLVVSGLQLSVLGGLLIFALRLVAAGPITTLIIISGAAWSYAVLCGDQIPVSRAALGLTLLLAGKCFFRQVSVMNILAAVALAFVIGDHGQLFEASFQLSFLAVAILGAVAVPLLDRTSGPVASGLRQLSRAAKDALHPPRVAEMRLELRQLSEILPPAFRWAVVGVISLAGRTLLRVFELALVSVVMQVGLAVLMASYFHRVALSGLTANLLVSLPMAWSVITGTVAVLTSWQPAVDVTGWLLNVVVRLVEWHAAWEPGRRVPDPPWWLAALTLFFTAVTAVCLVRRSRGACLLSAAAAASCAAVVIAHPFSASTEPGCLELTMVDVGQGESLLVVFPGGRTMLVDAGGIPVFGNRRKSKLDIGEDVVSPYLWSRSFRRLDFVAITHGHEDHAGGLSAVVDNFRPKELWTGPGAVSWHPRHDVPIRRLAAGDQARIDGVLVDVLSPPRDYQPGAEAKNNDSLVLRLRYGRHTFLLTGDIERSMEERLLTDGWLGKIDVLKVAHHGSRTSTRTEFLETARPAIALISTGHDNVYRFPHPAVLAALRERHAAVLRTDTHGGLTVRSDGFRLTAEY